MSSTPPTTPPPPPPKKPSYFNSDMKSSLKRPRLNYSHYLHMYTISIPIPHIWCDMYGNVREIPDANQPDPDWEDDMPYLQAKAFKLNAHKFPQEGLFQYSQRR